MNHSGDVAEQVLRMSLEGAEFAIKIVGSGAKNLTVLLYTILSQQKKTKGRARLISMLKSGKELRVFSVPEQELRKFSSESRRYGVLYCAIRNGRGNRDGMVDVMVRAEDAPKISRIVERFKFATVEVDTMRREIESSRAGKSGPNPALAGSEHPTPDKAQTEQFLDDVFSKAKEPSHKEKSAPENPGAAKTGKSPRSEPTSRKPSESAKGTDGRRSVRAELSEIRGAQKKAETPTRTEQKRDRPAKNTGKAVKHRQPGGRNKQRKRKTKERS